MKLLTHDLRECLLTNGRVRRDWPEEQPEPDFFPVVKLFTPDAGLTWLLTELNPDDPDTAFGLCDLGLGFPELGKVSVRELEALRGPFGLGVERDDYFNAKKTLSAYAADAARHRRIVV
jgi:hypothetical protein